VLVTEGKVAVAEIARAVPNLLAGAKGPDQARWEQRTPPWPAVLVANERVVIPDVHASAAPAKIVPPIVEKLTPEAVREALAWQGLQLVFIDTPLADAIAQFNRRNQVQIVLADGELGALTIGGSFCADNVDAFVRLLASGNGIATERPDAARIILRKAK